ncbi:MAG: hypothetical protein ABEK12_02665 [Candidatus Nanohaloarchaea archaeon]
MPGLDIDQIEKIRELYNEDGMNKDEIAEQEGHSKKTVVKYVNMSPAELEKIRAKQEADDLQSEAHSQDKKPSTTIRKISESKIEDMATEEFANILMYGEWVNDYITEIARKRDASPLTLLGDAVAFYIRNDGKVEKLEAKNRFLEQVVANLLERLHPEYQRQQNLRDVKEMIAGTKAMDQEVPEEVYEAYADLITGVPQNGRGPSTEPV